MAALELFTKKDVLDFLNENSYYDVLRYISENDKHLIRSIGSHGFSLNNHYDRKCIDAVSRVWKYLPGIKEDILIFRSGQLVVADRPYLSASFLRQVSMYYGTPKEILVCRGAKVLPLNTLDDMYSNGEAEILFNAAHIKIRDNRFEYQ